MTRVYFIVPAPVGISPGQRFRHEHYLSILQENNIYFHLSSFYSLASWKALYTHGNKFKKIISVFSGFLKRTIDLFRIVRYQYVYIYREAAPLGPPVFEWIIAKLLRKKIIYDFDDAIWIPVTSEYNTLVRKFRSFYKVAKICKWAYKVSVGNQFLQQFAKQYNPNTVLVPTVVNTDKSHNKVQDQQTSSPAIGWTGSFSTLRYIDIILPVLRQLQMQYDFLFVVIADKDPQLDLKKYKFIKWNKQTEANDLLNFHIGVMPLYDDDISKGKCGFKAIQYMSLGIPAMVSPVGVNSEIVDEGINGFLCATETDWKIKLEKLLMDSALRKELGESARRKIQAQYSVEATTTTFLNLFH